MVSARPRAWVLAVGLVGCGWELPRPDIVYETGAVVRDGGNDARPPDVATDVIFTPPDVVAMDVADAPGDSADATGDRSDGGDAGDVVDVIDVVIPDGGCLPPAFRPCFTGDRMTLGSGYCREGAQFCMMNLTWSTACEGEITRDCAGRECGTDGCDGSCGECTGGRVCDDTGHCVARPTTCGPANFTIGCGRGNCPTNSACVSDRCVCNANYAPRRCDGSQCPAAGCDGTDWWCAPAPFCGGTAITCTSATGIFLCPRWSLCDTTARACLCRPGFQARRCDGTACTACSGTEYECVPIRSM